MRGLGSLGTAIVLATCVAWAPACSSNRPLRKSGVSSGTAGTMAATSERCERPGDHCCRAGGTPTCADGLACEVTIDACVACGEKGQYCCAGGGCNLGLACDRSLSATYGLCTSACGLRDMACCAQGGCENGTACSTNDETGSCKACGLPGLKCCRGDCWIGVCAQTDAPRYCVQCGERGQPCCDGGGSEEEGCSDGSRCEKTAADLRGVCR